MRVGWRRSAKGGAEMADNITIKINDIFHSGSLYERTAAKYPDESTERLKQVCDFTGEYLGEAYRLGLSAGVVIGRECQQAESTLLYDCNLSDGIAILLQALTGAGNT